MARVAVLGGEGGIGKTRLAVELLARARAGNARVGRCSAIAGAPPFAPWIELLAGLARELEPPPAESQWPEELGRLAPSLPRRLGRARGGPADVPGELARARLFEAAVELAEHATADRPLVLLFDDVHVADAPTLELAAYLARRIEAMPVLIVLTRRMTPRRDEVDALAHAARGRGVAVRELELQPLRRAELEALVDAVERARRARPRARDRRRRRQPAARAGERPRHRRRRPRAAGLAARRGARGDRRPRCRPPAGWRSWPPSPGGRWTGSRCPRWRARRTCSPRWTAACSSSADGRFGFRHDLLREAVFADLEDVRRDLHHETLGRALRASPAEAARHLRLAGRDDLAAERLVEAAAEAVRATALVEATAYLAEAVELRPADAAIRLELADVLAQLGRREPARAALEQALALLDPADARARAAAHRRAALWFRGQLCDPGQARRSAQQGIDALGAGAVDDVEVRAELLLILAWSEVTIDGSAAADATLARLAALGLDLEHPPLRRHHLRTVESFALIADGRLPEAETALVASGEAGEAAGRPDLAYSGWANAACIAVALGRARAGARARRARRDDHGAVSGDRAPDGRPARERARAARSSRGGARGERSPGRAGGPARRAAADRGGRPRRGPVRGAGRRSRARAGAARPRARGRPAGRARRRPAAPGRVARAAGARGRGRGRDPRRGAGADPGRAPARRAGRADDVRAGAGGAARAATPSSRHKRLREAERHWRRLAGEDLFAREHLASLVDLGRPPVTGIVDPSRELERVAEELRGLEALADVR